MSNSDLGLETLENPDILPKNKSWKNQKLIIPWNSPWKDEQAVGLLFATQSS